MCFQVWELLLPATVLSLTYTNGPGTLGEVVHSYIVILSHVTRSASCTLIAVFSRPLSVLSLIFVFSFGWRSSISVQQLIVQLIIPIQTHVYDTEIVYGYLLEFTKPWVVLLATCAACASTKGLVRSFAILILHKKAKQSTEKSPPPTRLE